MAEVPWSRKRKDREGWRLVRELKGLVLAEGGMHEQPPKSGSSAPAEAPLPRARRLSDDHCRLRGLLDSALDCIILIDASGRRIRPQSVCLVMRATRFSAGMWPRQSSPNACGGAIARLCNATSSAAAVFCSTAGCRCRRYELMAPSFQPKSP